MEFRRSYCYKYINGNYLVYYHYGELEKIGFRRGEDLISDFPDSIDLKITNHCNYGCPYCHEDSTVLGKDCDIDLLMNKVISQLPRVPIEIAVGGGSILDNPSHTSELLSRLTELGYRTRVTINFRDLAKLSDNVITDELKELFKIPEAIGISIDKLPEVVKGNYYFDAKNFKVIEESGILKYKKLVYHIIAGVFPPEDLAELLKLLPHIQSVLVLGYKQWGRAKNTELPATITKFESIIKQFLYKVRQSPTSKLLDKGNLVFDNLALEQLHLSEALLPEEFSKVYLGDEGNHSMYIDAVNCLYARTSRDSSRVSWDDIGLIDFFKSLRG